MAHVPSVRLVGRDVVRRSEWRHVVGAAHGAIAWVARSLDRRRQRQRLAELTDSALIDIGVTRADAAAEARKPFWKP
jgi:uncharacterized protein YjiS (DUF1127 family)